MADFQCWSHGSLVKLAQESQAEREKLIAMIASLLTEYESLCSEFCKSADRRKAIRDAKEMING